MIDLTSVSASSTYALRDGCIMTAVGIDFVCIFGWFLVMILEKCGLHPSELRQATCHRLCWEFLTLTLA